ncbi:MAG: peptidoglycan DD-metalloendopeptidase family protein [Chloroflexi bacterium]|nr:peptidoglycan DD-metalloendopeptidase family protein [Chloroflexota bacterium]
MSNGDGEALGRAITESEIPGLSSGVDAAFRLSALRKLPRLTIALLIVGIVGVVMLVVDRAGWPLRQDEGFRQADVASSPISEKQDAVEPSTIVSDVEAAEISRAIVEVPRPTPTPIVHVVSDGESLLEIAGNYGVRADLVARANDLWDPNMLRVGQKLIIPGPEFLAASARLEKAGELRMWWPLQGEITTYFGEKEGYYIGGSHTGMDVAANHGAPVRAAETGRVVLAIAQSDNLGWHLVVDHGDGWSTLYGHLSRFLVDQGDKVERGQVIGAAGDTGFSLGPHLHFEVRRWGTPLDPLKYLP